MVRFISLLSAFFLLFAGCGKSETQPAVNEVEADTLIDDYKSNEVAAGTKYTDKKIRVTGTVRDIGKEKGTFTDTAYLDMGAYLKGPRIRFYFDRKSEGQFQGLEKGKKATVLGTCDGVLVKFKERLGVESFEDQFKKLVGPFIYITMNDCNRVSPAP